MRNTTIYHNIPKTFRRSSRQIFKKWGSNLQNVEKSQRAIYQADGYSDDLRGRCKYWLETGDHSVFTPEELDKLRVMLQCDQSGAEALIVAYEAEAADYRQLFIHGVKPHVYVALKLFKNIWSKKCKEYNLPIGESDIDILDLTPIPKLKNDPNWSQVDKLIKSSDNWKSSERYYYLAKQTCHCVDEKTEVFNGSDWVKVKYKPDHIQVMDLRTWSTFLERVYWNEYEHTGDMYYLHGPNVSQCVTPNHNVLYYCDPTHNNIVSYQEAQHLYERTLVSVLPNANFGDKLLCNIRRIHNCNNKAETVRCPTTSTGYFLIRREGKVSVTHNSANYGIEGFTFQMNILEKSGGKINISRDEADTFLQIYRGLFPEIPARCERVRRQVDKTHMLFNFFGHPYTITNYNINELTYKEFYAWCPQSTVGEITRIAFTRLQGFIEGAKRRWDILADTHDSYLVQCPLPEVKECKDKMQEYMNQHFVSPTDGSEFNMRSEVGVGFNWGPYKKDINDLGLRELKWI